MLAGELDSHLAYLNNELVELINRCALAASPGISSQRSCSPIPFGGCSGQRKCYT